MIERLFTLVIATAQARAALAAYGVNFVNKDDARRVLFGVVKHVAHARCAYANEHFHKVGAGDAEKRHLGLASNRLGEQGFAGSGGAHQQQTTRNAATEFLEFAGVFQEVDDFFDFFFRFVATGHIGKSNGVGAFVKQSGLAFAKTEGAALAATLHLAHEVHPYTNQEQHRPPTHQKGHEQRAFFAGFDIKLYAVGNQVADQSTVQVGGSGFDATLVAGDCNDFGAALAFLDHSALDVLVAHFF